MRQFFLTTTANYSQANTIPGDPGVAQLDILIDSPVKVRMQYGAFGQQQTFGEFELTQSSSFPGATGVAVKDSSLPGAAAGVEVNVNAWYQRDPRPTLIPAGAANLSPVVLPAGVIVPFAGSTAPTGFVLCDGSTYDGTTATYLALWQAIGNTYGGASQAAFAVPDTRGRVLAGLGSHVDVDALGETDGTALANRTPKHNSTNGLTLPNHVHGVTDPGHNHDYNASGGAGSQPRANTAGVFTRTASGASGYNYSATTGISVDNPTTNPAISGTVGPGGTRPVDAPAYIVVNHLISLGS